MSGKGRGRNKGKSLAPRRSSTVFPTTSGASSGTSGTSGASSGTSGKGRGKTLGVSFYKTPPPSSEEEMQKVPDSHSSEEEQQHLQKLEKMKVPSPPTPSSNTTSTSTQSTPTVPEAADDVTKSTRKYNKAELTTQQEVDLLEWYRENECLYNRKHEFGMNNKHKRVLKREQAEKMGITGKYIVIKMKCKN